MIRQLASGPVTFQAFQSTAVLLSWDFSFTNVNGLLDRINTFWRQRCSSPWKWTPRISLEIACRRKRNLNSLRTVRGRTFSQRRKSYPEERFTTDIRLCEETWSRDNDEWDHALSACLVVQIFHLLSESCPHFKCDELKMNNSPALFFSITKRIKNIL